MRRPDPLPAALSSRAFTYAEGLRYGMTAGRLRNRRLHRPSRGIRVPSADIADMTDRLRPYTAVTLDCAVSDLTAAALWGFPQVPVQGPEDPIHICRPTGDARARRAGVIGHERLVHPGETAVVDGVHVTTRARTWLDLAETVSVDSLVIIADHLIRVPRPNLEGRWGPYTTQEELAALIGRHRGKRGIRKARAALELSRVGADSPPETCLRLAIVRAGLPEPLVNQPIIDASGRHYHEPDLSYREYRIAIEYEGAGHNAADQVARDIDRARRATAAGWVEVRVDRRHLRQDAAQAVAMVRQVLLDRGWSPR